MKKWSVIAILVNVGTVLGSMGVAWLLLGQYTRLSLTGTDAYVTAILFPAALLVGIFAGRVSYRLAKKDASRSALQAAVKKLVDEEQRPSRSNNKVPA